MEVQIGLCTCSHGSFAGQSQQAFLLQDETGSNEGAGAHRQRETDVKVHAIHIHGRKRVENVTPRVLPRGDLSEVWWQTDSIASHMMGRLPVRPQEHWLL